jgi:two-component system cell cycle sensor histidine kinase/response regulator CckA
MTHPTPPILLSTDRVESQIDLALRVSVDSLLEGVQVIDRDWRYLYVNEAACRHGARAEGELLGRTMMACFAGIEQTEMFRMLERVMVTRQSEKMLSQVTFPGGATGWFEVRAQPVPDGICVLSVDVTERERLQAALRQSQKMDAVGRLAGGIAHDFNNVLTAMIGYCELVLEQIGYDSTVAIDVDQIRLAGERAARLTRQLLAFSRKQMLVPQVIDLNQVVVDVEKMLRRVIRSDIALDLVLAAALDHTRADPGQIEQVLTNLVINARDAVPAPGGSIRIITENVLVDQAFARRHEGLRPGRYVALKVQDTGHGMPPEVVAQIFEPFFTTKAPGQGTGLGMATVYGIVKQSEGYIAVESTVGVGTTLTVFLPASDAPLDATPQSVMPRALHGSETILLVEDDETLRTLMHRALKQYGYRVLEAIDVAHARSLSKRHAGAVHLLITDIVMPDMNGPNLAQLLLQDSPKMRVLYVSGYTHGMTGMGSGSRARLLPKPFPPTTLLKTVRECMD